MRYKHPTCIKLDSFKYLLLYKWCISNTQTQLPATLQLKRTFILVRILTLILFSINIINNHLYLLINDKS